MTLSASDTSVMLLAAGRGKRMRELTTSCPKPLLQVGDQSLIEHQLDRLASAGFQQIVINLDWHGEQIRERLGDGVRWGLKIAYSEEYASGALETAGGIVQALPLLDSDPILVLNADIWSDIDFTALLTPMTTLSRIVVVANPPHHSAGDFAWNPTQQSLTAAADSPQTRTFSGVGLYRKSIFSRLAPGPRALGPMLHDMIENQEVDALEHHGQWFDIGTPERLHEINQQVGQRGQARNTPNNEG